MRRTRIIFPIALAGSLALHLAAMSAYLGYWLLTAKPDAKHAAPLEIAVKLDDAPDLEEFGDAKGSGIGSNSSPGERPLEAPEADEDQALLSREPAGVGRIATAPDPSAGPVGDGKGGAPAVSMAARPMSATVQDVPSPAVPPPAALAAPQVDPWGALPKVEPVVAPIVPQLTPPVPERQPAKQPIRVAAAAAAAPPQPAAGDGRRPGVPQSAGVPLPQSESDSDPFARISGTVVFHDGRLDVRLGRKVKTVRPQIGIAGAIDAVALGYPTLVLEVHVEPTGRVSDVHLLKQTHSVAIDEPTRTAVYQWWFEPAHDKAGRPIADVVFFSIEFR